MRKIQADTDKRVETGALQINDDWAGLFIRGDDCLYLSGVLKHLLRGGEVYPSQAPFLRSIIEAIDRDVMVKAR